MATAVLDSISTDTRLAAAAGGAPNLELRRRRRILRAVEAYKAACAAEGKEPTEEDSWLVLLAALQLPD